MTHRIQIQAARFATVALLVVGSSLPGTFGRVALGQDVGPVPAPGPAPEGVEVMTRGVVHEAFAEVVADPRPGLTVPKRPPDAIDEVPPEFKPEGDDAIWITGYWVWDDERDDFFWQSGVWRVPPPGMRWVAGYWNETPAGWQWISGFWVPIEEKEIRYYDDPPASLEAGPSSPAPSADYFWAQGSWIYYDTGYRWQPGYWAPYREDWVWIPARYVWTPAGCVYLPGRWDLRLTRRGCMFAPVYFTQPVYTQVNYVYRPWCALNTSNLFIHLWVRPNYCHFYFGNYYGSNWGGWGVTPWCHYRPYRNCYDPVLTQLQCHYNRQGVNYINRLDGWNTYYARNASARPARTWNEQVNIVNKTTVINNTNITNVNVVNQNILAVNLKDDSRRKDMPMKFARLDSEMQKTATAHVKETRDLRRSRMALERPADVVAGALNPGGNKPSVVNPGGTKASPIPGAKGLPGPKPDPDLAGKAGGEKGGGKASDGNARPRPVNKNARLTLPTTVVSDAIKAREKTAPPKLVMPKLPGTAAAVPGVSPNVPKVNQPGVSAPGAKGPKPKNDNPIDLSKPGGKGRGPGERNPSELNPDVRLPRDNGPRNPVPNVPQPRLDNPVKPPKVETPNKPSKLEIPNKPGKSGQPKRELPTVDVPQPRFAPGPAPNLDLPKPRIQEQPRLPRPQPKLERPEIPRGPKAESPIPRPTLERPASPPSIAPPTPRFSPRSGNPGGGIPGGGNVPNRNSGNRPETRERPQIKLDIPRSSPRSENKPRGRKED